MDEHRGLTARCFTQLGTGGGAYVSSPLLQCHIHLCSSPQAFFHRLFVHVVHRAETWTDHVESLAYPRLVGECAKTVCADWGDSWRGCAGGGDISQDLVGALGRIMVSAALL
jgi:hypothetical protein